jgi:hypothetical protein
MNILKGRWTKFKRELPSIIYISTVQIWWNFNFPAWVNLKAPWNTILGVSMSIGTTIVYIFIFSFADKSAPHFNLEYLDKAPNGQLFKNIERTIILTIVHVAIIYEWYYDFFHMPNIYYVLLYVHYLSFFVLIFRAINRDKK